MARSVWIDEKARERYNVLCDKIESVFKVPPEIARAEPKVFQDWFYQRQREAAHMRIDAGIVFLTFTQAPK